MEGLCAGSEKSIEEGFDSGAVAQCGPFNGMLGNGAVGLNALCRAFTLTKCEVIYKHFSMGYKLCTKSVHMCRHF